MAKAKNHKTQEPLRIIPLGGLDGIGKNMTAFEYANDMILVDAGLMFPDDDMFGVDLVLPDYTYVLENEDKLRGIIITHGHEDHTGSLPYLLKDLIHKVPILSSKLTLGLVEGKLAEHKINKPQFQPVSDGERVRLGAFDVEFFSMTHSIPGALGVFIRTPQGSVLHTGDFKLDQTPIDGVLPNYHAINLFATEGIDLLLSDSTNATVPGFTKSEASVGGELRHIIKNAPGRVFVASFSSHIHRLQQICDIAHDTGRKVVVTGRSMLTNTRVARELGYLHVSDDDIIDAYDLDDFPGERIVVLCTGSQGEPLSALARMARGEHRALSISENATVIISATPVPGNEKSVQSIINSLAKIGCEVYDRNNAHVHVSGHGSQEELKLMLAMTAPKYFMPVHGEALHLRAHAALARTMGWDSQHIFVLDNGDSLEMREGRVRRGAAVESGTVYVDGGLVGDTEPQVLRDRQRLSQDGIVSCVVAVNARSRKAEDVQISSRGVSFANDEDLQRELDTLVRKTVERDGQSRVPVESTRKDVRNALSNLLWAKTHTRPMVISVVMEV